MTEKLTSINNPKIKRLEKLSKPSERREQGLIIIEGFREIKMATFAQFEIVELYYCEELVRSKEQKDFLNSAKCLKFEITSVLFEKIAYRKHSDGIIALAKPRYLKISDLKLSENPLIIVLEAVEKPGNLGAILRTSDGAGVDAILVCDTQTDIFNPNVIRSSLGCIFSKQVVVCNTDEAIRFFKNKGIITYAAALTGKEYYHQLDFTKPTAVVLGTEADGLTDKWLKGSDKIVKIPMLGEVDSLNVSVSAAVLVYEVKRQRNFK